jgi:murein DD-endopeptidase MepM/ murein hydrolase activator NlpD
MTSFAAWCSLAFVVAIVIAGVPAEGAEPQKFELPIACRPAETCWIANYFDHDPGPAGRDYACGTLTYDGHDGTDFAIRNLSVMRQGTAVLAAADGTVRGTRDGMPDVSVEEIGRQSVKDRECGNGVVINHGGGWTTQYCHLRRGSVAVKTGNEVVTGQELGLVGLSGNTMFPHLEFVVRHEGQKVDPFVGLERSNDCGPGNSPLWTPSALAALAYQATAIYNAGFAGTAPKPEEIREGRQRSGTLPADSPAIVFWVDMFGVTAGDEFTMRIVGPGGDTLAEQRQSFEKTQARRFEYLGKKRGEEPWHSGSYRGEIVVVHRSAEGTTEFRRAETVIVE